MTAPPPSRLIAPGGTIGVLGGGQLGRMLALVARRMGYRIHILDPDPDCPAGQVADVRWTAPYDDVETALRFARAVDVVTFEFENVPATTLAALGAVVPVHPSPHILETTRHRIREKETLHAHGFPVAPFRAVFSHADLTDAVAALGTPCILKTATFGYDGKGQTRIDSLADTEQAWALVSATAMSGDGNASRPVEAVLEGFVRFSLELSVIVARTAQGAVATFPVAENHHAKHILDVTVAPAGVSAATQKAATDLAVRVAECLDLVGVLAVEMFLIDDGSPAGQLVINELAPRPHNSGHFTIDACVTSQFEQQLRAICALPLGDTTLLRPVAMANLLGDVWTAPALGGQAPHFDAALALSDVKLHLYGKAHPRPGRKMGHLVAMAADTATARARVEAARGALMGLS